MAEGPSWSDFQPDIRKSQVHTPERRVTMGTETQESVSVYGNHLHVTFRVGGGNMGGTLTVPDIAVLLNWILILKPRPLTCIIQISLGLLGFSVVGKTLCALARWETRKAITAEH